MNQRVDEREWIQFQWPYLLALLGGAKRVNELAYETSAFVRRRELRSPADVLQLLLTWAVAERSLRETAVLAAEAGMADVSDVALLKRFMRGGEWLAGLMGDLLARPGSCEVAAISRIRALDATTLSSRGSKGTDRRVHMSIDLRSSRMVSVELTDVRGTETLERHTFQAGEIVIADRGYAHRKGLAGVAEAGAYFIVRVPWATLPLEERDGRRLDLLATLRSLPEAEAGEFAVQFRTAGGKAIACRLVAIRKSEAAAALARQKALANARRHGAKSVEARTLEAAGYFMVLTNLPSEISAKGVLELYRLRWQIEMKFKTLKSVLHLGNVPTRNTELLNVYVTAKLLIALLIEELIEKAESISPWGYPIVADQLVASDTASA
jgi:hypothetical protein